MLLPEDNFLDATAGDWQLRYISPCRDAGTDSYGSPNIVPSLDFNGGSRVSTTDIGAYEVQYSKWTGDNDDNWDDGTNWQQGVIPSAGSGDVIIPAGRPAYPITTNFTVAPNKFLIISPAASATIGSVTNNGTIKLESDATNVSSLMVDSYNGSDATVELYLSGGNPGAPTLKLHKWHYISTPVSSINVADVFEPFTLHVVGWYDNLVQLSLATGWVAYDGYVYSTGAMGGPEFTELAPGYGYDYYGSADNKFTFSGQLNTARLQIPLSFATPPADPKLNGFNLIGNPFSTGLDWDYIIDPTNAIFPANTSKALNFTKDNAQVSYVNGVSVPLAANVTSIIPPMQGFFIKTYSTGNTLTIPLEARTNGDIPTRYKGSSKSDKVIPLVRLSLSEDGVSDETVVRFDDLAKSGLDYDYDAVKMFLSTTNTQIYSTLAGTNYIVNGLPFPETLVEIPVTINVLTDGNHSISTTQLEGLENYSVTLTDNSTGFIADLNTTPDLSFSAAAGTIADRFILKISKVLTGTENPVITKTAFNIYPSDNVINITTLSDNWDGKNGSIRILDLSGKTISDMRNAEFRKNSILQVAGPAQKGMYIVEIRSGVMRYVGKVVIR